MTWPGSAMWSLTSHLYLRKGTFMVTRTQSRFCEQSPHRRFFTHFPSAPPFSMETGFSKAPCRTPEGLLICSLQSRAGWMWGRGMRLPVCRPRVLILRLAHKPYTPVFLSPVTAGRAFVRVLPPCVPEP